jgi:hypothetical protein
MLEQENEKLKKYKSVDIMGRGITMKLPTKLIVCQVFDFSLT